MNIIKSTDGKYLGTEIPNTTAIGSSIALGDFEFRVEFVHNLENGNKALGNANYQLECEE